MRLPFLQVAEKFITVQSKVIARILGIDRATAIGLGNLLFETAVELTSSDESPPTGIILGDDAADIIEAGMEWHGERGKAFGAFVRADVIERLENGARVKGCDRYRDAWEKQKRKSDQAKQAAKARWGDASCVSAMPDACERNASASAPHVARNAQTETETHTETQTQKQRKATATAPPQLAADLVSLEEIRARKFESVPLPYPVRDFEARWQAVLDGHGGDRNHAFQTFARWCDDPWAQGLRPPGAINAFLAPDQWPKHRQEKVPAEDLSDWWQGLLTRHVEATG